MQQCDRTDPPPNFNSHISYAVELKIRGEKNSLILAGGRVPNLINSGLQAVVVCKKADGAL